VGKRVKNREANSIPAKLPRPTVKAIGTGFGFAQVEQPGLDSAALFTVTSGDLIIQIVLPTEVLPQLALKSQEAYDTIHQSAIVATPADMKAAQAHADALAELHNNGNGG
jgi:hypothetical protein